MYILVINAGSSSIKYRLFEFRDLSVLASGKAEKIGERSGILTHRVLIGAEPSNTVDRRPISDHHEGLLRIAERLTRPDSGVIRDRADIAAIGHRVVHGGEGFREPTLVDERVLKAIRDNIPLAPLHNPPNLMGIEVARAVFPDAAQVAVFDTAFHQTLPMTSFLYALPFDLYRKHRVRRYGFHGTSHAYVSAAASAYLGDPERLRLITVHLGNGASMAAVRNGACMDTTMGMTPLGGLVMGTRPGDVDPGLHLFLENHLGMSPEEIDRMLNRESGLRGICGENDMREVLRKADAGDRLARVALDVYTYRVRKTIGAYAAALEGIDALVFTAGVGENSSYIRASCCMGLAHLGVTVDRSRNEGNAFGITEIQAPDAPVKVLVVPTNEELRIAQETRQVTGI